MLIFVAGLQNIPEELYERRASTGGSMGAIPSHHRAEPPPDAPAGRRAHHDRPVPALRRALRDDGRRAAAEHGELILLMYEQGFRWWRLGYAARWPRSCCSWCWREPWCRCGYNAWSVDEVRRSGLLVNVALVLLAILTLFPLLWMVRPLHAAGRRQHAATAAPARHPTLEHYVRSSRDSIASQSAQQPAHLLGHTVLSLFSTRSPGTPSPSCASAGAIACSGCSSRASRARAGRHAAALLMARPRLVNTPWGVMIAALASIFGIF